MCLVDMALASSCVRYATLHYVRYVTPRYITVVTLRHVTLCYIRYDTLGYTFNKGLILMSITLKSVRGQNGVNTDWPGDALTY